MDTYILTSGRFDRARQHTLRQLEQAEVNVIMVVQEQERDKYHWYEPKIVLPPNIRTVSHTRDYLLHDYDGLHDDKMVMFDDDLHFAVRREDDATRFRQPTPLDLKMMLAAIDRRLDKNPMVGIGAREGGNRVTADRVYNTRIMRVMALRRSYCKTRNITFSPMQFMEDFHMNLQILRSGADTCLLNTWVSNQAEGSNAPGGCSMYRTPEAHAEAADLLAARHPGFVRTVMKETKEAWGGGKRKDVVVSWKKARESAEC